MKDKLALVHGWFRKADSDLANARRTVTGDGPYDTACFHAQQAIEKYLKGYLAWREQPAPRTHDLEELQLLCIRQESLPELASLDLTNITAYGVELRYDPEFWPPQSTAAEAITMAEQVRTFILRRVPPMSA